MLQKQVIIWLVKHTPIIWPHYHLAVRHMASSLAVEWAKKGVRVNVLRQACRYLPATLMLMHLSASPGYMLTKLTKTILEHDQDLKVWICPFMWGTFTDIGCRKHGRVWLWWGSTFNFTKWKKFPNLLIAEVTEAIVFVLSTNCEVPFCRTAVTKLLGWRDEDIMDGDVIVFMNGKCV